MIGHSMRVPYLLAAALMACGVFADVPLGENILCNGCFTPGSGGVPPEWDLSSEGRIGVNAIFSPSGGPEGLPSVKLRRTAAGETGLTLRQYEIGLSTGGTYRLSAKIRTKGFRCASSGLAVIDGGWNNSYGIKGFPEDSGWTPVSATFKVRPSSDGVYSAALYAEGLTSGEIEIADFRLEAMDAAAAVGADRSAVARALERPRLVPWRPLHSIPSEDRTVIFRVFGRLPPGTWRVAVETDGSPGKISTIDICGDVVAVPLPSSGSSGRLTARLERADGSTNLVVETFPYRVADAIPGGQSGRRLNNLVMELLAADYMAGGTQAFTMPRDGWAFLSVTGGDGTSVRLDGRTVIEASAPQRETFRRLAAGRHDVVVAGSTGGRLVVRAVPEILNYCPCAGSPVPDNPSYGWNFAERHVLRASTVQNGGFIPADKVPLLHARGGEWLANMLSRGLKDGQDLAMRLAAHKGMVDPLYDGVTCDEQAFDRPRHLELYTAGLKAFNATYAGDRTVHTWTIGHTPPLHHGIDEEYMAAVATASQGRGRMLLEHYCRTQPDEAAARTYLDGFIGDMYRRCRAWYPPITASAGIILGGFTQLPVISLRLHPEVDYKYYLDMQLNMLANDPLYKDLPCTGVWGSYYADEEMHRWIFRLLRHYCVEGRTDMLSKAYGLTYRPGHLRNGDFRGSLDPWVVSGDVRTDEIKGLGRKGEGRWKGAKGIGDTFAAMRRNDGPPAVLRQKAEGLTPGRLYCLEAVAFDAKDARAGKVRPGKIPLSVKLSAEAEAYPGLSWVHVDRRRKPKKGVRINLHHVVFVARGTSVEVSLDNADARPGDETGVNFVSLNPYYGESR